MVKQQLGKYEVQERLGRGGMAEVYRAYHANLDRYVAIKVLHAFLAEDDEFRVRFEKEARNIAKLNHAHIVQVYDFDYEADQDSYYMVMELITGDTLKDLLYELSDQNNRLPLKEVLRIIRQAASALAYAHSRGMIHRDVKPANLMLDTDKRVVLTDFGIAKMLDAKQLTVSGGMIGTPAYMAPEQGLGEAGDERSDIYSLGVIMYQLLVGELPYDAETALGVILMHVNDPIPVIRDLAPEIPEDVQRVVNRAMAKDPSERYQTADKLIEDIESLEMKIASGEVTRVRPPGEIAKPAPKTPSRPSSPKPPTRRATQPQRNHNTEARLRAPDIQPAPDGGNKRVWFWGGLGLVLLVFGGLFAVWSMGGVPALNGINTPEGGVGVGVEATAIDTMTPSMTPTATPTPTNVLATVPTTGAVQAITETNTPTVTISPTDEPTQTSVPPTATQTPTATDAPPSATPNVTATVAAAQTATIAACEFDYAIVDQVPDNGEAGGFFRVNEPYQREITFLNTGTCAWGENTSLTFLSGEDFDAGPRIFIRDSLQVGEEVTVLFEGATPIRGSLEPFIGTWQLRTRGQISIGAPLEISVMVFDPGS